jgi:uncharacterized coiled-coil DUF342 family protein
VVLKKPSQLFESNRQEKSTEPPNLFESIDRFRGSLENVDQISTQIQELSEELSQKVSKTELENTLLSHLLVLEENFDHIQKQIKGINKNDIRQFKESVSDIGEVVDNLIHTELPKYKKQVAGSELRIEKRLDTFTETFDSNFSILENQLAEKMEFCLQRIEDILGELRYDEQIAEHSKVLDELKESTSKLSSDVEVVERYISNHHSDVIDLREELLRKIELLPIEDLAERINQVAESYNKISEEITLAEGLLNEPPETDNSDLLTPLDQNFVTLDQLNAHYKLFLARIQQQLSTVGGGGETQLKYLDDIVGIATNASAYDGKFLKYDHSIGKFEFVTVSGGGSGDYASVAGIATFATTAGVSTYADTAGISTFATTAGVSTYASVSGVSTVSQGLTGTPNITVGVVTATSFVGSGTSITGIVTSITAGSGISIDQSTGNVTITATGGGGTQTLDQTLSFGNSSSRGLTVGVTTVTNLNVSNNVNVVGVATIGTGIVTTLRGSTLNYTGVSTFASGPVLISSTGTATTTGTSAQPLQVTGGAYVSESVGIGSTNPREKLDVIGTIGVQASGATNRFVIEHNTSLNSLDFNFV